jgi:hypothetical protein
MGNLFGIPLIVPAAYTAPPFIKMSKSAYLNSDDQPWSAAAMLISTTTSEEAAYLRLAH